VIIRRFRDDPKYLNKWPGGLRLQTQEEDQRPTETLKPVEQLGETRKGRQGSLE
jgi:hypothetical protein